MSIKPFEHLLHDLQQAQRQNLIKTVYTRVYQNVTSDLEPTQQTTQQLYIVHHSHTSIHIQNKLERFFQHRGFKTQNYHELHTLRVWLPPNDYSSHEISNPNDL